MALAVVERWPFYRGLNNSQCMDCPSGQNKGCRDSLKRWPGIVAVRLYTNCCSVRVLVDCTHK